MAGYGTISWDELDLEGLDDMLVSDLAKAALDAHKRRTVEYSEANKPHYHSCPECYEKWACALECTIEPDLEDTVCHPGKQFGSHCICPECEGKVKIVLVCTKQYYGTGVCTCGQCKPTRADAIAKYNKDVFGYRFSHKDG